MMIFEFRYFVLNLDLAQLAESTNQNSTINLSSSAFGFEISRKPLVAEVQG